MVVHPKAQDALGWHRKKKGVGVHFWVKSQQKGLAEEQ